MVCAFHIFNVLFKNSSLHQYHHLPIFWWDTEQILCDLKFMSLKDHIFQVTQIQVTIYWPLLSTINILSKCWERISVWPLSKRYARERRIHQSWRWESTNRSRQTLEPCCRRCKDKYCNKLKLSQDTFS